MPSDRKQQPESELESVLRENAALKRDLEWLSRQFYGRVMPGLFAAPSGPNDSPVQDKSGVPEKTACAFHESAAAYHVRASTGVPPDISSDQVTLELPPVQAGGLSVAGYESSEAIAARPAVIRRTIRRTMYVSNDGSGMAVAAPAPALFPDPSGGPLIFDASFVAHVAFLHVTGMNFRTISELLESECGLALPESSLRDLTLAATETVMPLCADMVVRTLPDWNNLRRMFGEAKSGGDWFAEDFLKKIRALGELEELARIRADRIGGAPEDLYRERRTVRRESAGITAAFFAQCREMLPAQNPQSPLADALRYAIEHERSLSEFLHDPRIELSRANPETPVADPFAALAVCAGECRMHGVSFRAWLEDTLVKLKQPNPPPFESLFPR